MLSSLTFMKLQNHTADIKGNNMDLDLRVHEIFYGLQGEGNRMGMPSVFLRLGGCNLSCKGFGCKMKSPLDGSMLTGCDTIYAANMKHFNETWKKYNDWNSLTWDLQNAIPEGIAYNEEKVDVVITGGEPLIQHKNSILINTVSYFISRGHKVWFETNGTIPIDFTKYDIYKKCHFSISVKMALSGEPEEKRWFPKIVNSYIHNTENSYFKFVFSKDNLDKEQAEMYSFLYKVPSYGQVYCMPLGDTREKLFYNAKAVYEFAASHGFRYSDRIHIRIHDNKQGV